MYNNKLGKYAAEEKFPKRYKPCLKCSFFSCNEFNSNA